MSRLVHLASHQLIQSQLLKWPKSNPNRPEWNRATYKKLKAEDPERLRAYRRTCYQSNGRRNSGVTWPVCPSWADRKAISAIYAKARKISRLTGVKHHVDHIIPINGELICGLHVESNLQIITAEENMAKGNSFPG